VTQFHACYVNGMLLLKATVNASITCFTRWCCHLTRRK